MHVERSPFTRIECRCCIDLQTVQAFAAANGLPGVLVFVAAYVACTVLFVPGSALTLAAGAIYGVHHFAGSCDLSHWALADWCSRQPQCQCMIPHTGPLAGTAVVSVASTLGALAAFTVSRTAARPWVEQQLAGEMLRRGKE
jgi:uncharacterized membrane protein YdjX (TVP38/TMEM64 family)